jgi:hypothetical protein
LDFIALRDCDYKITTTKMPDSDVVTEEIRLVLETINGAWLSGNPEGAGLALSSCFHADMVIKDGNLKTVAAGRDACVQSYVDFIKQARVSGFELGEPDIHYFADSAIASYDWRIAYSMDGKDYDEHGANIFLFVRAEEKWMAVRRAMLACC